MTKYKTTVYNQGTDRMLEIIYAGILWGRDKAVEDLFGEILREQRWHSLMKRNHFTVGSEYISQQYESLRAVKQKQLDKDLQIWYTLPKVENPD